MPEDIAAFVRLIAVGAIPVLFGITLHEVGHGWMARRFGDRTAEQLGRLSLNPLHHVDPVGTVLMPLVTALLGGFLFGWAKPVPVNARAMRDPKRAMIAVAAAGPGANLLMAIGWGLSLHVAALLGPTAPGASEFLAQMGRFGIFFNVVLGLFNLLPIPPLDGGRVLRGVVPESVGQRLDALEPYGLIIVIALLAVGVLDQVLGPPFVAVRDLILWLTGLKGG
jgi:Zn-dependent protease